MQTPGGRVRYAGDARIDGVPGVNGTCAAAGAASKAAANPMTIRLRSIEVSLSGAML